ncbi:MAG: DUF1624 domain-containing protein [Candidatus Hydrogenedentes bacterium]|nr:DUF1624 domain-containing protein [Candidatus Hydrogenedentota bacterium]
MPEQTVRLKALDQARGYAIAGMVLVNVLGCFTVMPWMLKHHHEGFSYADHIAPLFIFLVGMGFRMSFQRRAAEKGLPGARRDALRRYGKLMGLGLLYGGFSLRVGVWDALMDIGMAGVLSLPVIHLGARARVAAAVGGLALYQALYSMTGYGAWLMGHSINGGPLGPLSWMFILLMGTLVADWLRGGNLVRNCAAWGAALCAAGWLLRAEWPGVKAFWYFSQFGMTAPYPVYAAGLCFFTVLAFHLICDRAGFQFPLLTIMGKNPLVLYLLQAALVLVIKVAVPSSLPAWAALAVFAAVLGACYTLAWWLDHKGKIIKV